MTLITNYLCLIMNIAYLLLGSNEDDRHTWLQLGTDAIIRTCGTILKKSAVYETAAWGLEDQPDFLNQVLCIQTPLKPDHLLAAIQKTEKQLGRQRTVKWGQRTLDIDILFFNDLVWNEPHLKIPHPYLAERRFTLAPLVEIAPSLEHPVLNKSLSTLLLECQDPLIVRKIN